VVARNHCRPALYMFSGPVYWRVATTRLFAPRSSLLLRLRCRDRLNFEHRQIGLTYEVITATLPSFVLFGQDNIVTGAACSLPLLLHQSTDLGLGEVGKVSPDGRSARPTCRRRRSIYKYTTGVVNRVSAWLTMRPPTMVKLSGRRNSAPVPVAKASGNPPSNAAIVVIMMGRKRSTHASWIASKEDFPSLRSASSAKSIIMMAFFLTRPINRMIPINPITFSSWCVIFNASRAPTPAEGIVERIVMGCMKLS